MDIYNSQLRYGFRYLVYLVSPLLLERLTSISILLYQFEGQAYDIIHNYEFTKLRWETVNLRCREERRFTMKKDGLQ
jgi:hypothetical protein